MKLFQVVRKGSLWTVFAVSANAPNERESVWYWVADEQTAIDHANKLNRIAATYEVEPDKTNEVDLSPRFDIFATPKRKFRDDLD